MEYFEVFSYSSAHILFDYGFENLLTGHIQNGNDKSFLNKAISESYVISAKCWAKSFIDLNNSTKTIVDLIFFNFQMLYYSYYDYYLWTSKRDPNAELCSSKQVDHFLELIILSLLTFKKIKKICCYVWVSEWELVKPWSVMVEMNYLHFVWTLYIFFISVKINLFRYNDVLDYVKLIENPLSTIFLAVQFHFSTWKVVLRMNAMCRALILGPKNWLGGGAHVNQKSFADHVKRLSLATIMYHLWRARNSWISRMDRVIQLRLWKPLYKLWT